MQKSFKEQCPKSPPAGGDEFYRRQQGAGRSNDQPAGEKSLTAVSG